MSTHGTVSNLSTLDDVRMTFDIQVTTTTNLHEQSGQQYYTNISIGLPLDMEQIYKTPINWKLLTPNSIVSSCILQKETDMSDTIATALMQVNETQESFDTGISDRNVIDDIVDDLNRDTHSTEHLNELDNQQAIIVELNNAGGSSLSDYDIHAMWKNFVELPKRKDYSKKSFSTLISNAETLNQITKAEIVHFLKPMKEKLKCHGICSLPSMRKQEMINKFITVFGDGSSVANETERRKSPKPLRLLVKSYIQSKVPKQFLNAAHASFTYESELQKWRESTPFTEHCKVNNTTDPPFWYAQPKYIVKQSQYLLDLLDPEHLLTNTRSKVCTTGFQKAGIHQKAWLQTAQNSKQNGSNLNVALVENLVDKQNVGFALKTFSLEVESAMRTYGYTNEASFCKLIRNWYRAQDEGGIPSEQRRLYETELREWLLQGVSFDVFPPAGRYIKDIPVTLFEGLMIHIDRRAQLYSFTNGSYNARSIGTLDNENLFGAFQDWDAKGTGVLRADEVPQALYTACDLYKTRLNDERGFHMHTSAARVYPVPPCIDSGDFTSRLTNVPTSLEEMRKVKSIVMRDHAFDIPERRNTNAKRKKGQISDIFDPSRGNKGIRAERYSLNEAKILPHVRAGIDLPNVLD